MPDSSVLLYEINGDQAELTAGEPGEGDSVEFARAAESLQSRAFLIGSAIGMNSVAHSVSISSKGTIGFVFSKTSAQDYDAKGLSCSGGEYSCSSIVEHLSR